MTRPVRTLLIDNYDSFTFNLFQLIAEVNGTEPLVVRNDGEGWDELAGWEVDNIVLSPGPGHPARARDIGVCADAIRHATVPILGVCLGHQALAHAAGGSVVHAPEARHGRLSAVHHDGTGVFAGLPQCLEVVRYHSLCVAEPLPPGLVVTARADDGVVMGLRDRARPRFGVQFHPESVCTAHGRELLAAFRDLTLEHGLRTARPTQGRTVVPAPHAPVDDPGARYRLLARRLDRAPDAEAAFLHLHGDDPHAWWLDTSRPAADLPARSFLGGTGGRLWRRLGYDVSTRTVTVRDRAGATETLTGTGILDHLAAELDRLRAATTRDEAADAVPFDCGFVGWLGYELKADTGCVEAHRSPLPDAMLQLADRVVAIDHASGAAHLLCLVEEDEVPDGERWLDETEAALRALPRPDPVELPATAAPATFTPTLAPAEYLAAIDECRRLLLDGESYEICLTTTLRLDATPEPLRLYRILRRLNPAPWSALLRDGERWVAASSPERFLAVSRDGDVEARPMKGTAARSTDAAEDARLAAALREDEKTRAECLMITDLLRNDIGLVCEIGSVHVPALFALETYETVHQLVSVVRGRLRPGLGAVDAVRACFPPGSMTGAPKRRTTEILDRLEPGPRGVYSGALGYLGLGGAADLDVVIRTVVHDGRDTTIGVGGAIVVQSEPEAELEETMLKARALLDACAAAAPSGTSS